MNDEQLGMLETEKVNPATVHLDTASEEEFLQMMSRANAEAARAVDAAQPALALTLREIKARLARDGRLIYCGAGTSGRLGVLDASECPPTFGVPDALVVGVIAGGDRALRFSSENAEDSAAQGEEAMRELSLCEKDVLVAIAASGRTPYCLGALRRAREVGAKAIALVCNAGCPMSREADIAIELATGPEVLTGSTRLKAGTATKMALNALSTGAMIGLGKVYKNLMVDMLSTNDKLRDRAIRMFLTATETADRRHAQEMIDRAGGNVKLALVMEKTGRSARDAAALLERCGGHASKAIETVC